MGVLLSGTDDLNWAKWLKMGKPMKSRHRGPGVIRLIQVSEWKALPIWTCNTLQAFITDKDKQMSGYHSQHASMSSKETENPV